MKLRKCKARTIIRVVVLCNSCKQPKEHAEFLVLKNNGVVGGGDEGDFNVYNITSACLGFINPETDVEVLGTLAITGV